MNVELKSKAFPNAGIYIMRHEDLYMIVDCIPSNPKAPSAHIHNSRLSFELFVYDQTFIVDPGTYIYTADAEWRNKFRSTAYHNTVIVDGEEQNEFDPYNLFSVEMNADVKVNEWKVTDEYDFLDAQHNGYTRLSYPVIHRRQILFSKIDRFWLICDFLTGKQKHKIEQYFHFAPMSIEKIDQNTVITNNEGTNLLLMRTDDYESNLELIDGWVSYSYGTKTESQIAKYSGGFFLPVRLVTVLYPHENFDESLIDTVRSKVQKYLKSEI